MVVSTTDAVKRFNGNGSTTVFNAPVVGDAAWLVVTLFSAAGVPDPQVLNTDFTYSMSTGQITMSVAPALGTVLVIERDTPLTQPAELEELTELPAKTLEGGLDRLTFIAQDLDARLDRALLIPVDQEGVDAEELLANVLALAPVADEMTTLAPVASSIPPLAPVASSISALAPAAPSIPLLVPVVDEIADLGPLAPDIAALAAILNQGSSPFTALTVLGLLQTGRFSWSTPVATVGATEAITDTDNLVSSGLYYIAPDAANRPPLPAGQGAFLLHLRQFSDTYWCQFAIGDSLNTGIVYMRNRQGGAPGAWRSWLAYQQSLVATASGTQHEFLAIPNGVNSFRVIHAYSLSAAANVLLNLRTSPGGVITSGYTASARAGFNTAGQVSTADSTTALTLLTDAAGATAISGETLFRRLGAGDTWFAKTELHRIADGAFVSQVGRVTGLTNPVSGVRLTATAGAFNGGGFYVEWGG